MKKAVIVLAVILVLILIGGVGYIVWDNAQSNIGQAENNKSNETIVNDTAKAAELREKLKGNFPKMDGSTSTIPLEAGIVAAFEGISQEEAEGLPEKVFKAKYSDMLSRFSEKTNMEFPLARIRLYLGAYYVEDRDEDIGIIIDKSQYCNFQGRYGKESC